MSKQTAEQIEKALENDYPMIPMSEITDEARMLAVAWGENMVDKFINQKQKLASDIMNYARRYASPSLGWIRASERLPLIWQADEHHYRLDKRRVDGEFISKDIFRYYDPLERDYRELSSDDFARIEWLDESMLSESPAKPEGEGKEDLIYFTKSDFINTAYSLCGCSKETIGLLADKMIDAQNKNK